MRGPLEVLLAGGEDVGDPALRVAVEERDQALEVLGRCGLVADPRREPEPVSEPAHLGEDLEAAARTELLELKTLMAKLRAELG